MATFDYASYAATVAAAQNKNSGVKVGFFKLADGCEALVRFNVPSLEALTFASIHRVKRTPEDRFAGMSISCLNPLGKTGECPLCAAVEAGDDRVQKVGKRVYVQLLVSYKDKTTGTWSAPAPVIWERPASTAASPMSSKTSSPSNQRMSFICVAVIPSGYNSSK